MTWSRQPVKFSIIWTHKSVEEIVANWKELPPCADGCIDTTSLTPAKTAIDFETFGKQNRCEVSRLGLILQDASKEKEARGIRPNRVDAK